MKKSLYGILALLVICFSFVACDDDDNNDSRTHSELPEIVLEGTYNGNYEVYNADGVTHENTYSASVVITKGENPYSFYLESICSEAKLNGKEQKALNAAWANDDIKFYGPTTAGTTSGFLNPAALNGIYSEGTISFRFSKTVREGRKTVTNFYNFVGTKQ